MLGVAAAPVLDSVRTPVGADTKYVMAVQTAMSSSV
jgi:hypothetical protein